MNTINQNQLGIIRTNDPWDSVYINIKGDFAEIAVAGVGVGGFNKVAPYAWQMDRTFAVFYASGAIPAPIYNIISQTLLEEINQ